MAIRPASILPFLKGSRPYSLYVLCVLMVVYLLNQADRFLLGVTGKEVVNDLRFGESVCLPNITSSLPDNVSCVGACIGITSKTKCTEDKGVPCTWEYSPVGIRYELLVGPAFTFVFTLAAIPLGILASNKWVNRSLAIGFFLVLWSGMTLSSAFTREFWELLLARLGLGLFEAVCTPFATSIISDRFDEAHRGTALGFYNWGIYLGYSTAFAFNFILKALNWKWVFIIASIPGFAVAVIHVLTVREPKRKQQETSFVSTKGSSVIRKVLQAYLQPALLLLCIGGGFRLGAGLVWAYNVKPFFTQLYCEEVNVGIYLSWVPIVGGTLGTLFGGLVSDRLARASGYKGRMWVLILSQIMAAPFLVGAIYLPPNPWAFLSLIPGYIIGETWLGICLTVAIETVPLEVAPASIALFLFISNNISSAMPLLVPVIQEVYGLQRAMLILFPGLYVLSAILFGVSLAILIVSELCRKRNEVKSKLPKHISSAAKRKKKERRRRRGWSRPMSEGSPLLQEEPEGAAQSESDSDSDSGDFVEIDEDGEGGAAEGSINAAATGTRPIIINPSTVGRGGRSGGAGIGRGRGKGYGATNAGTDKPPAHPAPEVGSVSAWSTASLSVEDKSWLVESQGGI